MPPRVDHRRQPLLYRHNGLAVLLVRHLVWDDPIARQQARDLLAWLEEAGDLIRRALAENTTGDVFGKPKVEQE